MSFGTRPCVLVALLALPPLDAQAAVRQVPAHYPTIQGAISAASVGDTILVAPGTYFENVVIDRRVALVSEAGAEVTTIDGQQLGPVILVQKWVDHAVIDGFRVTHGLATTYAGGINVSIDFLTGGYATIRRNIVEHNHSYGMAGGIYSVRQSIIQDNIIQYNNSATVSKGICAMEVSGAIERNIVRYNGASGNLQNVRVGSADPFAWNIVVDNTGSRDEVVFGAGGSIHHNTFVRISSFTPTVALWGGSPSYNFYDNVIVHGSGGGLDCHLSGSNTIRCNDVWGAGQSYKGNCAGLNGVDGNFSADPLFCGTGDYRLSAASPCLPENSPAGCGLIGALESCEVLAVHEPASVPALSRLEVSPNPSSGEVVFSIPGVTTPRTLEIFDAHGRQVDVLRPMAGEIIWNPSRGLTRGIYFARIASPNPAVVKFVLLR
jgi:hypothetical protein